MAELFWTFVLLVFCLVKDYDQADDIKCSAFGILVWQFKIRFGVYGLGLSGGSSAFSGILSSTGFARL